MLRKVSRLAALLLVTPPTAPDAQQFGGSRRVEVAPAYPFSAIGKWTYGDGGSRTVCTAFLVNNCTLVTARRCGQGKAGSFQFETSDGQRFQVRNVRADHGEKSEAKPEAFIGVPKTHVARRVLGWARETVRVTVTTGSRLFGGRYSLRQLAKRFPQAAPLPVAETRADETAAILFTSGSTGVAKGVVYTHGIFAAQVEALRRLYGIEPGEIDLATFPLFALFAPALGMTAVVPDMDPTRPARVNPANIVRAVED